MLVIVLVVVIDSRDVSKKHPSLAFVHVREQRPAFEQERSKFDNEHEHDSGTKGRLIWGGDRGVGWRSLCRTLPDKRKQAVTDTNGIGCVSIQFLL